MDAMGFVIAGILLSVLLTISRCALVAVHEAELAHYTRKDQP